MYKIQIVKFVQIDFQRPQVPLGELTALPCSLAGINGTYV